jgi:hypothetical protein
MRLDEIVDTNFKTTELPSAFDKDEMRREKDKNRSDKSSGAYAKVDVGDDEPFTAKKKYHEPMKDVVQDAYYVYIKTIADQHLAEKNPYFPRVYDVEIEKDSSGEVRPIFRMETLTSASEFDDKTLYALGDKIFNHFERMLPTESPSSYQLRYSIAHAMTRIMANESYDRIKDSKLESALKFIKNLVDKNENFRLDLHFENFMIRPTSHGPQLVLTDPVANQR